MSEIRVTYSGLIAFAIRLSSVLTGIVFTLIVTRELSQEEFGTWSLIGGLLVYVIIIEPIISFWTTREIARGNNVSRTSVITNGLSSIVGILVYLVISFIVGVNSQIEYKILFFASILIPVIFVNNTLNAICTGWKPHVVSYGFLMFEITKIPVALLLVYFMALGIEGAILSTFVAHIIGITTLLFFVKSKIKEHFNLSFVRNCIRKFWLPTYRDLPPLLFTSDVVIFSIITASVIGVAYYSAARTIAYLVMHIDSFSSALYPKFLAGGKQEYLQENLNRLFYFAFPIMAISIIFAKPGLFALNPTYEVAAPIIIFLTIRGFLSTINKTFYSVLQGVEKVDIKENATFIDYIKSKLFWIPSIRLIQYSSYLGAISIGFFLFNTSSELELVIIWSLIGLLVEIPVLLYLVKMVKNHFTLKLDYKAIIKYLASTILIFSLISILVGSYLDYDVSIFEFLPDLLLFILCSIGCYLGITYLIDHRTRGLFNAIIKEIR